MNHALWHYPKQAHHCRFQTPFTTRFWINSGIPAVTGVHITAGNSKSPVIRRDHYRFQPPLGSVQFSQHCSFVAQADSVVLTNTASLRPKPVVLSWPTLSVCGSSRSVSLTNTIGSRLKPVVFCCPSFASLWVKLAVMSSTTLPTCSYNQQWCLEQHCRLVAQFGSVLFTITVGFVLTDSDLFFAFYCFIIYYIYFFMESGFALYSLHRQHVHQH
jgi:hypothetical protein